jgi:hypothetical protein
MLMHVKDRKTAIILMKGIYPDTIRGDGSLERNLELENMMETNPYNYDTAMPWVPQQNQLYRGGDGRVYANQQRSSVVEQQRPQQRDGGQKPKVVERMPKARALALVSKFKKGLVVASLVSFGTVSGLAAFHQIGTTTSSTSKTSSGSSQSTSTPSSKNSSSFLNQGGNNLGSSSSSTGSTSSSSSSSGSSSSSSSTQSVTGSHTS